MNYIKAVKIKIDEPRLGSARRGARPGKLAGDPDSRESGGNRVEFSQWEIAIGIEIPGTSDRGLINLVADSEKPTPGLCDPGETRRS